MVEQGGAAGGSSDAPPDAGPTDADGLDGSSLDGDGLEGGSAGDTVESAPAESGPGAGRGLPSDALRFDVGPTRPGHGRPARPASSAGATTGPTAITAVTGNSGFEGTSTTLSPDGGSRAGRRAGGALAMPDRYLDLGPIGRGGMGDVRRVRDRKLDQVLAMKLIRWTLVDSERARQRFIREARLTARLQHPGIVSVHDVGELPDGRLWFTMREVRGRTLARVIRAVHRVSGPDGWGWTEDEWHLQRLLGAFEQACQAVAYAHSEGVVHRDLKPDNIMVGAFGEVLVMDWGIARLAAEMFEPTLVARPPAPGAAAEGDEGDADTLDGDTVDRDLIDRLGLGGASTRVGAVLGSPAYMAPEQARGDVERHGPATDVWALGAILRTILTGHPPGVVPRVDAEGPPTPPALDALVRWSMAPDPAERPPHAGRFAAELRAWLDGTRRAALEDVRRRAQAEALVAEADARLPEIERLRAGAESLRERADRILQPLPPDAPAERKRPGWQLQDDAETLDRQAEQSAMEVEQALVSALTMLDLPEAHARLADRARALLDDATRRHDDRQAVRAEALLRAHGSPDDINWLDGPGSLTLLTDPPGAAVVARRIMRRDRRFVEGPPTPLGRTPLVDVGLERGRWMLHIEHPGRAPTRYPVRIDRGTRWTGVAPETDAPAPIRLLRPEALGPADRYVPAGWFYAGGDPEALDGLDGRWLWVDGFVMRRDPVTIAEYRIFLDALVADGRRAEAERHQPRERAGVSPEGRPIFTRLDDGRFGEAIDGSGARWADQCPMPLVDLAGARAYADWLINRTGLPWRLPTDLMWEKAARGVDGRWFPWGDFFEPTWACTAGSQGATPGPAPVHAHPVDESPYGIRGLAGGVREWCDSAYRRAGPPDGGRADAPVAGDSAYMMVRGGSWHSTPAFCRLANRFATRPDDRLSGLGFRLCRPLVDAD